MDVVEGVDVVDLVDDRVDKGVDGAIDRSTSLSTPLSTLLSTSSTMSGPPVARNTATSGSLSLACAGCISASKQHGNDWIDWCCS